MVRTESALGVAAMAILPAQEAERSLHTLMVAWKDFLDLRSKPSIGKPWKRVLKDRFGLEERIGLERFARATEGNFNAEEGRRLFEHWSDDGRSVQLAAVIADLETTVVHERALFAHYNTGGSLDPVPRSAFPKAQIESNDSPHKNAGEGSPYSELLYEPASIERRPLTAAQPAVPAQPGHREAGLSLVAAVPAHPSCTSVEGGIFSRQFTHAGENAAANDPLGGNRSNLPSLRGGIFADHSNEPVAVSHGTKGRSQLSSVPGGIFAAAARPATVEYGQDRSPDRPRG